MKNKVKKLMLTIMTQHQLTSLIMHVEAARDEKHVLKKILLVFLSRNMLEALLVKKRIFYRQLGYIRYFFKENEFAHMLKSLNPVFTEEIDYLITMKRYNEDYLKMLSAPLFQVEVDNIKSVMKISCTDELIYENFHDFRNIKGIENLKTLIFEGKNSWGIPMEIRGLRKEFKKLKPRDFTKISYIGLTYV